MHSIRSIFKQPFIACTLFASVTHLIAHEAPTLITPKEGWVIASPPLIQEPQFRNKKCLCEDILPATYLHDIGERAHDLWLSKGNNHDTIASFQELFNYTYHSFLLTLQI
jgi:hypothetical protein